ncbi:MAG: glycosyltransferase family 4 protein [Deltaproteobacteria bacterium]|nr:glycosyltransferase family 4 protein [Deltaproteobacteria bacterium]
MKVAVVIPKYGSVGGAEGFAFELVERLAARQEIDLHVFSNRCHPGAAPVTYHHVPILPFPRFMRQISFAWGARRLINHHNVDVIHSHDRIFRMDVCSMHGIPHRTWITETRKKRMTLFDRAMVWVEKKGLTSPPVPLILPVSHLVKRELLREYDILESRIQVIHPGVALERFSRLDQGACRREVRERHGLSADDVVALFVGMNFEIKRLSLTIKALGATVGRAQQGDRLKLLVVGQGNETRYRAEATHLGIGNRVIFAGVRENIEPYYLAGDFFVMPSVFDTFGMAVLEAMAAALPVIITEKVGARDLIKDGDEGFVLCADPSYRELSEKMACLLRQEKRLKMAKHARIVALEHGWETVTNRMFGLYRSEKVNHHH